MKGTDRTILQMNTGQGVEMSTMFLRHSRQQRITLGLLALFLFVLPATSAPPAEPETADIPPSVVVGTAVLKGKVLGKDGKTPMEGVVVHAYHLETERNYVSGPTNSKGEYEITELPHGYVDLAVETPDGVFVGNQVVNLAPAGKAVVTFTLIGYEDRPRDWWADREPRGLPGLDKESTGVAELRQRAVGREFWKSPKGVALIAGAGGATLLAIASGGGGDSVFASPSAP